MAAETESSPLVEVRGLVQRYQSSGSHSAPDILRGIDLQLGQGESIAVLGPSGSGKSTLLHVMGALLPATQGQVLLAGQDLGTMTPDALALLRNQQIGYVFQAHHLLPQCTALENVLVPTLVQASRSERQEATTRARELLRGVGLGERLDHRPAQLSGGECQRVAVVRALINQPRLLLADEPTGSLDLAAADHLGELLSELNRSQSVTLVTVTHSERLAARMQRVFELRAGLLQERGEPAA